MLTIRARRLFCLLALAGAACGCRAPSWAVGEQEDPRDRVRPHDVPRDWDPQSYRDARDQRARYEAEFQARNPAARP